MALAQRFKFVCLENYSGFFLSKSYHAALKKKRIGAVYLRAYKATNKIQSREYSRDSGIDGILHKLWAVNTNWNDDGWKFNANPIDNPNDWNADNQVFGRNYFLSPTPAVGVFASKPFFQPPTIFPISSISLPKAIN